MSTETITKKRKRQGPKAPLAQFVAIIALTISIFLIVDLGRRAATNYRIQREAEHLTQEVEAARQYQTKLLARRTYAASDLYVEEIARNELKWAEPGETVVVVMPTFDAAASLNQPIQTSEEIRVVQTPQQAWWELFFGNSPPDHFSSDTP
jgi:cell division protein FtsB